MARGTLTKACPGSLPPSGPDGEPPPPPPRGAAADSLAHPRSGSVTLSLMCLCPVSFLRKARVTLGWGAHPKDLTLVPFSAQRSRL